MWVIRAVLIAILLIAVVGFAYYNFNPAKTVDIDLIYTQYVNVPLVTVVFWAFVAGVLMSLILFVSTYIKISRVVQFIQGTCDIIIFVKLIFPVAGISIQVLGAQNAASG